MDLRSCPFCGSDEPEEHDDERAGVAFVYCGSCHGSGPMFEAELIDYDAALQLARQRWNERAD